MTSKLDFSVPTRRELDDQYRVFFVTSWGYAADHLFGWFPKALNCHRDVFALLAHEGSRPKYLKERTRGERPPLVPYTEFLNDMGMTYSAIGDCYSYRAGQVGELLAIDRFKNIPVVNLVRHPVAWLEFYVRWRSTNMRMGAGAQDPLQWEWKVANHHYFDYLGLQPYSRDDINIWASHQGMFQLNNILGDLSAINRHVPIERVADDPIEFLKVVDFLGHQQVRFDQADLERAYSMRNTLFRGEEVVECDPVRLLDMWPGWKVDAFRKLVSQEAKAAYASLGYELGDLVKPPPVLLQPRRGLSRPLLVSSVPKSGTWLLREMLEMITGLKAYEPEIELGLPRYDDENLIEFPLGTFFSWHLVITPPMAAMLAGCQSKNIFLVRNIYDVLLSMFTHLSRDVDTVIDRSTGGCDYFQEKSVEQSLAVMISGFTSPKLTWSGVRPLIRQISSFLDLVESGHALLLSYELITDSKREAIHKIMQTLECSLSDDQIDEIIWESSKNVMRERLSADGLDKHITLTEHKLSRDAFLPYHKEMIDHAMMEVDPRLPERLSALGFDYIFSLADARSQITSRLSFDGSEILLISDSMFPLEVPMLISARWTGASFIIGLELMINRDSGLRAIVDLMHDKLKGGVLQFTSELDSDRGKLCFYSMGTSLVTLVPVDQWISVSFGYDATDSRIWMQVEGSPLEIGNITGRIFSEPDIQLGIAHWLPGGREFCGQIRNLRVQGLGRHRGMLGMF